MKWYFSCLTLALAVILTACGKNDPVIPYGGNQPYSPVQAPAPPNYSPSGNFSPGQFFPQAPIGQFRPQMPMNRPQQYYPFLPIDNYMRRDPRLQQYWGGFWNNWQNYAGRNGINPYDFSTFWFEYCPEQWSYTGWADLYNYFDSNFYYWTQPGMQFYGGGGGFSAEFFWGNAYDFPMPQYDLCNWGC